MLKNITRWMFYTVGIVTTVAIPLFLLTAPLGMGRGHVIS